MGYTNYWSVINICSLPDEFIDKVRQLITYYKQKHQISDNLKLFCELSCSSISCNPNFYIIDGVIKQPFSDDTVKNLTILRDDVSVFLKCMVEYFITIIPNIKGLIQKNDVRKIISLIPQYPLKKYTTQDVLRRQFNSISDFIGYMYLLFKYKNIKISFDKIEEIYYNEFLTFNGTLDEFLMSQVNITKEELKEFRERYDFFSVNDPFKYINGYNRTNFNINSDLIKNIIFMYPNLTDDYVNRLIVNYTEDIYNIISYTYYLLKNTYWTFNDDKQYYVRVEELDKNDIVIKSCYESISTSDSFCKTARYGYDSLVKTFIILCGYYKIFDKWWNTDDNFELKSRLPEIQEYLKCIGFRINKLYDSTKEFGYYESDKEVEKVDGSDCNTGIYVEIMKVR